MLPPVNGVSTSQREIRIRLINGGTHKRELAACIALNISATPNADIAHGRLADL